MNDNRTETLKKELLGQLRKEMNGAVVESMRERLGSEPFFSYGVSVPDLKRIVRPYYPDHELAVALFDTKIRELKLAALYLEEGEKLPAAQMEAWSESFVSPEIADHACVMLFFKSPDAPEVAERWLGSASAILQEGALMMAGKRVKTIYRDEEQARYSALVSRVLATPEAFPAKGSVYFLAAAANRIPALKAAIEKRMNESAFPETIREELSWQII